MLNAIKNRIIARRQGGAGGDSAQGEHREAVEMTTQTAAENQQVGEVALETPALEPTQGEGNLAHMGIHEALAMPPAADHQIGPVPDQHPNGEEADGHAAATRLPWALRPFAMCLNDKLLLVCCGIGITLAVGMVCAVVAIDARHKTMRSEQQQLGHITPVSQGDQTLSGLYLAHKNEENVVEAGTMVVDVFQISTYELTTILATPTKHHDTAVDITSATSEGTATTGITTVESVATESLTTGLPITDSAPTETTPAEALSTESWMTTTATTMTAVTETATQDPDTPFSGMGKFCQGTSGTWTPCEWGIPTSSTSTALSAGSARPAGIFKVLAKKLRLAI